MLASIHFFHFVPLFYKPWLNTDLRRGFLDPSFVPSPSRLIYFKHAVQGGGGLMETGGLFGGEGLFNLAKMVVSVLHKELECKVKKLKYKKSEVMRLRIKNKSELPNVNKPSQISPNEILQSWVINTFFPLKGGLLEGGAYLREGA